MSRIDNARLMGSNDATDLYNELGSVSRTDDHDREDHKEEVASKLAKMRSGQSQDPAAALINALGRTEFMELSNSVDWDDALAWATVYNESYVTRLKELIS